MWRLFLLKLSFGLQISFRRLTAVAFLVSSALAWFFVFFYGFTDLFKTEIFWVYLGNALFLILTAVFAVGGAFIAERVNRRRLLFLSILIGAIATLGIAFLQGIIFLLILSAILGDIFRYWSSRILGLPC